LHISTLFNIYVLMKMKSRLQWLRIPVKMNTDSGRT
jgi:hypothetical protein